MNHPKPTRHKPLQVGASAPAFSLPTQQGEQFNLQNVLGKAPIVLFFYPKDNTSGCIQEVCNFRDQYSAFQDFGATIIGISADSPTSHQRFQARHQLPFLLLSDKQGTVRRLYGVPKTFGLIPGRVTYVIDGDGVVRHIFNAQFQPQAHIQEALKVLKQIHKG